MAKSRKSPPPDKGSGARSEEGNAVQFFIGAIGEGGGASQAESGNEPINHTPYVDMYSTKNELTLEIEMPGVRLEEIELSIFRGAINIRARKYECFEDNNVKYICMERSFGSLFRTIEIPMPIDSSMTKATYNEGILKVTFPRVSEKRGGPKKIKIVSEHREED